MPFRQKTPNAEIADKFEKHIQQLERAIVRTLSYVGERVVNEARTNHTYKVQTGNLSSSIGYIVLIDGRVAKSFRYYQQHDGAEGVKKGRKFLQELIAEYPQGIVLVVVAGMNYAAYVAAKGYIVLESAELLAERLAPQMLKSLNICIE